jgi:hypothetical protein
MVESNANVISLTGSEEKFDSHFFYNPYEDRLILLILIPKFIYM